MNLLPFKNISTDIKGPIVIVMEFFCYFNGDSNGILNCLL